MNQPGRTKDAGSTYMGYYKTLKHVLGIDVAGGNAFMDTIRNMYPIVKSMLDEICEAAKQEMKDKKDELGSWKHAVNVADSMWQTRGWHSKNATFTITNYLNGALLYYHHLCQRGRDDIIKEDLYKGCQRVCRTHNFSKGQRGGNAGCRPLAGC